MKYSGLFFINNPTTSLETSGTYINELIQNIETNLTHVTKSNGWSLTFRLFRDTIDPQRQSVDANGRPKPYPHTYQHMLNHTGIFPEQTYIHISPPDKEPVTASIPRSQQDGHAMLVRSHMAAQWQPRHALRTEQGVTYESGMCAIQVGELRANREGPGSGNTYSPGVVICISTDVGSDADVVYQPNGTSQNGTTGEEDGEVDFEYAQAIIRDCWHKIKGEKEFGGRAEVKEVMMLPKLASSKQLEREVAVRMWCEVLRLRG